MQILALPLDWFRANSSSMALFIRHNLIKTLQGAFPRGTPFDSGQLRKLGVSPALAHHYLNPIGWPDWGAASLCSPRARCQEDSLKFLSRHLEGFHVGGKTALAWRGIRHNLPARESGVAMG